MLKLDRLLLREFVFGAQDGIVSTLVVILALHGNPSVMLAGLATTAAGTFSMGAGAYLSARAEADVVSWRSAGRIRTRIWKPLRHATAMGVSFGLASLVPVVAYGVYSWAYSDGGMTTVVITTVVSLLFLTMVGVVKGLLVGKSPWINGMEILIIGALSAALGYMLGYAFGLDQQI